MKNQDILQKMEESHIPEMSEILINNTLGIHEKFYLQEIDNLEIDFSKLINYGIEFIKADSKRPDGFLSAYFFAISALKNCPGNVSNLAIDAKLFFEYDEFYDLSVGKNEILEEYKNLK